MKFLETLMNILNFGLDVPKSYGWFHLLFFALSIALGIFLCIRFRNPDENTVRHILLVITVTVAALELYKQFIYSFSCNGEQIKFDYQWYIFPFQFCSIPMYVGFLAVITKKAFHKAFCSFLVTYSLFAGICVMVYPTQVFVETVGINIQSMVCHGTMISVAIFLLGSGYVKPDTKTMLRALPVFASAIAVAIILNEVFVLTGIVGGETFNMFFISRHYAPSLPVYSLVQKYVPYPWCVFIYFIGFSLASYIILFISRGIFALINRPKKNTPKAQKIA